MHTIRDVVRSFEKESERDNERRLKMIVHMKVQLDGMLAEFG